ncbi:MAG: TlpA family protein disulfide reductase [Chitinophagaceae bacterium]
MNVLFAFIFHLFSIPGTEYIKLFVQIEGNEVNKATLIVPVNENLFLGFANGNNEITKTGNNFSFIIPCHYSSFFLLKVNGEIIVPLALKSGDSVSVLMKRIDKSGRVNYDIIVKGNNADAHNIYQQRFFPAGKNLWYINDLAIEVASVSDYFLLSKNYIDSVTSVWDSLQKVSLLDKDIYKLYLTDTRSALYYTTITKLQNVNKKDLSYAAHFNRQHTKMVMYQHSQAFNTYLLKTWRGQSLYSTYLQDILKSDESVTDSILKASEFGYFYYYDLSYREFAWGGMLYEMKNFFPTSNIKGDLNNFKKYYPNSIYINKIERLQDSMVSARKSFNIPVFIDTSVYKSIYTILSNIDKRFVFIDLWATWCFPCIQQFNFLNTLSPFLESKEIEQVFISLDNRKDLEKWKKYILEHNIPGRHYLSTETIEDELLKILSQTSGETDLFIPRYLLYDKQNNKFHIELPKPSTGVVLINKIEHILSEK